MPRPHTTWLLWHGRVISLASTSGRCGRSTPETRVGPRAGARNAHGGRGGGRPRAGARPRPSPEHPGRPDGRPDPRHVADGATGHAVAPIPAAGPERPLGVVPERGRVDPALLSLPRDDPHRSVRHANACPRQRRRPLARRHQHAPRVVAPSRVHDRVGGEVPQLLPMGSRAVRSPRLGSLVREGERERVDVVLRLRRRRRRVRPALRCDLLRVRHRRPRRCRRRVRDAVRRPTVPGSSISRRTPRTRRGSRRTATATHRRAFPHRCRRSPR